MNQPLTEGWAAVARHQKARAASTDETTVRALDLRIDRQIDRIATNQDDADDPAEARRAIATLFRRERYRARLLRLHFAAPASDDQMQRAGGRRGRQSRRAATPDVETGYAARQALDAIFAQTSPQDAALLLSAAQDESLHAPGLTAAAARKRLSRLRERFSYLKLDAA
jgi:hypothetical protein